MFGFICLCLTLQIYTMNTAISKFFHPIETLLQKILKIVYTILPLHKNNFKQYNAVIQSFNFNMKLIFIL